MKNKRCNSEDEIRQKIRKYFKSYGVGGNQ